MEEIPSYLEGEVIVCKSPRFDIPRPWCYNGDGDEKRMKEGCLMAERIKDIKNLAIVLRDDDGRIGINMAKDLHGEPIGVFRMTEEQFNDLVDGLNEARKLIQKGKQDPSHTL